MIHDPVHSIYGVCREPSIQTAILECLCLSTILTRKVRLISILGTQSTECFKQNLMNSTILTTVFCAGKLSPHQIKQ